MMPKRKRVMLGCLISAVAASFVVGMAGTFAWFDARSKVDLDTNVAGQTEGSYFARGRGSQANPYIINKPRHLYNLAWLNYMGYFENRDNDGDGVKGDMFYFELDPALENNTLSGLENGVPTVIPPIGTSEHPFYGNFNGNGKTITDFVVSNVYTDYNGKTPANVSSTYFAAHQPEIVGFVGVIGAYPGKSYTYTTAANEFKNVHLQNITVKTGTARSLAGTVAGYVNGILSNVTIDTCSLNISNATNTAITDYTGNISDYGLVGYCTTADFKKSVTKVNSKVYQITTNSESFVADTSGGTDAWGGSIAMKNVHERLNDIRSNYATYQSTFYNSYETNVDADGNIKPTGNTRSTTTYYNTMRTYTETYNGSDEGYNRKIGSYVYWAKETTNNNGTGAQDTGEQGIIYMGGGHKASIKYDSYRSHTGFQITDGTNYLTVTRFTSRNAGTIGNTTNPDEATVWSFDNNGRISTTFYYNNTGDDPYYNANSTRTYYLRNNSGTLTASNTSTTWTRTTGSNGKYRYVNDNKYINFNGTNWVLTAIPTEPTWPSTYFTEPEPTWPSTYFTEAEPTWGSSYFNETEPTWGSSYFNETEPTWPSTYFTETEPTWGSSYFNETEPVYYNPNDFADADNTWQIYTKDNSGNKTFLSLNGSNLTTSTTMSDIGGWYFSTTNTSNSNGKISTSNGNQLYMNRSSWTSTSINYGSPGDANNANNNISYDTNTKQLIVKRDLTFWPDTRTYYLVYDSGFKTSSSNSNNVYMERTSSLISQYNAIHDAWQGRRDAAYAQYESDHIGWVQRQNAAHDVYEDDHEAWQGRYNTAYAQYESDHAAWQGRYNTAYAQYESDHAAWVQRQNAAHDVYEGDHEAWQGRQDAAHDVYESDHLSWVNQTYNINVTSSTTVYGPDSYYDSNKNESGKWEYYTKYNGNTVYDTTYFPINVYNSNDVSKDPNLTLYEPTENNTGYFVGGGNSNLRFGRHSIASYLSTDSYSGGKFVDVKTYNGSNISISSSYAAANFEKYDKTIQKLESIMSGQSNVYGMHFYNSQSDPCVIDTRYKTKARWVSINNEEYEDYELLVNSVDFNLKEQGIINFVAGTYGQFSDSTKTSDVDSFFSLHVIQRSGNIITQVDEIEQVLTDNKVGHSYVYKLVDKTGQGRNIYTTPFAYGVKNRKLKYKLDEGGNTTSTELDDGEEYVTTSTCPTGYNTVKFKTEWLKKTGYSTEGNKDSLYYTPEYAYYFEIPINDGEYALGNVESGVFGAYLMYLDIGASALSLTRTSTYEHFKEATNSYTLPLGVMLKDATDAGSFDYTDSIAMGIAPGYHGTMIFERNATGNEVTITGTDATYSDLGYFSDRVTSIHKASSEGGGQITLGGTAVVTDIYQLRYLDYNENTGAVIETILKDTYVNGVQSGSRDVYRAYWDGSAVPSVDIYNSITNGTTVKEDGTPIGEGEEVAAGVKLNTAQINSINVQLATSDVVIEFRFTDKVGVTHSIAYNLDIDDESGGPSFETEIEGYSIVLTITGGEVKVQVLDLDPTNVADGEEGVVDYVITINGVAITNTYPTQGAITIPIPAPAEPEPEPGD